MPGPSSCTTSSAVESSVYALALIPLGLVGFEYIPPVDRGEVYVTVTYPSGTPLSTTRVGMLAVERAIDQSPDVRAESTMAGAYRGQLTGYISNGAIGQSDVYLKDARTHSTAYWAAQFQAQALGIAVPSQLLAMLPYLATIIVLTIISRDLGAIRLNAPASLGKPYHPEA